MRSQRTFIGSANCKPRSREKVRFTEASCRNRGWLLRFKRGSRVLSRWRMADTLDGYDTLNHG